MKTILKLFLLNILLVTTIADFPSCPKECNCGWASGSKQANCSRAGFQDIPDTLGSEIQTLDLTGNNINEIKKEVFLKTALINLKKLIMSDCKLTKIHKNGFKSLEIMIGLDLSKNQLKTINPDTFKMTPRIRWIILNDNQIEKLEDGLFNNLPYLKTLDLSNNHIAEIGATTFLNVPKLELVTFDGNRLAQLNRDKLNALTSIYLYLDLHNNPWRCDCQIKPLRDWVVRQKLNRSPILCSEPAKHAGKSWEELNSEDFGC